MVFLAEEMEQDVVSSRPQLLDAAASANSDLLLDTLTLL